MNQDQPPAANPAGLPESGALLGQEVDCTQTLHRLFEYLDGEMSADETRHIAVHLAACAPCMDQHDVERAMRAVVRRSCQSESAPPALRASIMARITTVRIEYTD